jgi:hypothetical protein
MKTKTWQEEFDERFILKKHNDYVDEDSIGEVATGYGYTNEDIKQFISDLRKRDMEALIKMMDEYFRHLIIIPRPDLTGKKLLQLIKDYYENN